MEKGVINADIAIDHACTCGDGGGVMIGMKMSRRDALHAREKQGNKLR
jgi:hypothetical protein